MGQIFEMNSSLLTTIHLISVNVFLLIYLIKTVLLFSNRSALDKFTRATRIIEMIVSTLFLLSGVWLIIMLGAVKTFHIIKLVLIFISIPLAVIGFRKYNKVLALISLLLIVGAYGLAEMAKNKPFIPSRVEITGNADEASKLGIKTYIANCAMCHGEDGKKMYREAKDLSASGLDEASIELKIREGTKGKMPAYTGVLSDDEIHAVSAYVMTLKR